MNIIGGNWDISSPKHSKIISKLSEAFPDSTVKNGGFIQDLPQHVNGLTIWMPNITNELPKNYPSKSIGTCLIVSKVVRPIQDQHKFTEAVTRIFKMNANAVIAIEKESVFKFTLIDALGNIWSQTENIEELASGIKSFHTWHLQQQRQSIKKSQTPFINNDDISQFMDIVRTNASNIMNNSGSRYFGNCSTRCQLSFPSSRTSSQFLFSPRNSNKQFLNKEDMVIIQDDKYYGNQKPSVDTPVHLMLYKHFHNINFMIHGHAFFQNTPSTKLYCACGDIREYDQITNMFDNESNFFSINLINHGYLVASNNLNQLQTFLHNNIPVMQPFRRIQ